jgi:hypothetical protein
MWHAWDRREKRTRFQWVRRKERDILEDQDVDGRMGYEWMLWRLAGGGVWSGFSWLKMQQVMAVVNVVINLRVLAPRS